MKVLVIKGVPTEMNNYYDMLQEAGFEVIEAGDAAEGIEKLFRLPDIVLLISDVDSFSMRELKMIKKVRKKKCFANVPIIMTSKEYKTIDNQKGFAAGVDAYIFKPFEPEMLMENINLLSMH